MKSFISLLSSFSPASGVFWLIMLFAFCFFFVHLVLYAKAGWDAVHRKKPTPTEKPKDAQPEKKPEPVYYIVEKKKKRPKSTFSEPREIHF